MRVAPNMPDYDVERRSFSWEKARSELDGLPGGGLNIAYEAVTRHVRRGRGDRSALRWVSRSGRVRDFSYGQLDEMSNRFANALVALGVRKGDRIFTLLGRSPELYAAALGAWKCGAVLSPLFSAFGPEPIARCGRGRREGGSVSPLSHRIVTQHGGRIWVEGATGGGGAFKLRLKATAHPARQV